MNERLTISLKFWVLANPATASDTASVEFLEPMDQPYLLLFKSLDISMVEKLSIWRTFASKSAKLTPWDTLF